ncbi:MAG TPA: YciI family protein [Vicinamibacterales bacterium]
MRTYLFVLLRRGPAWSAEETPESKRLFEGHMANIKAMGKAGKLVLAGPFDAPAEDRSAYAGLFVLDVKTEDEARALLANDPAIAAGRLVPEFRSWYGPAGITFDGASQVAP